MKDLDVEFYNTSKQLEVYEPKNKDNDNDEQDKKLDVNYGYTVNPEPTKQGTDVQEIDFFIPSNLY